MRTFDLLSDSVGSACHAQLITKLHLYFTFDCLKLYLIADCMAVWRAENWVPLSSLLNVIAFIYVSGRLFGPMTPRRRAHAPIILNAMPCRTVFITQMPTHMPTAKLVGLNRRHLQRSRTNSPSSPNSSAVSSKMPRPHPSSPHAAKSTLAFDPHSRSEWHSSGY